MSSLFVSKFSLVYDIQNTEFHLVFTNFANLPRMPHQSLKTETRNCHKSPGFGSSTSENSGGYRKKYGIVKEGFGKRVSACRFERQRLGGAVSSHTQTWSLGLPDMLTVYLVTTKITTLRVTCPKFFFSKKSIDIFDRITRLSQNFIFLFFL